MTRLILVYVCLVISNWGCSPNVQTTEEDTFRPSLLALFVEDIDRSIDWYTEKLHFKIEKETEEYPDYGLKIAFLELNDFHLEIIEKLDSFKKVDVAPDDDEYIGGTFKTGFTTKDLESLYNELKKHDDVTFITGIGELPERQLPTKWPSKYFLITDPDGNFLQFFDSGESELISPWLTMITVENIENSISWYSEILGFHHHETVGEKGNQRAILERNNYVLELFEPEQVIKANEISADTTILGFAKISFEIEDITAVDQSKVDVVSSIDESSFEWASRAMMLKDIDGNWVQLFEGGEREF